MFINQFVMQWKDEFSQVLLDKKQKEIIKILNNLSFYVFLDCRSYTLGGVGFFSFTLVSTKDISPTTMIKIADKFKNYSTVFSYKSLSFNPTINTPHA